MNDIQTFVDLEELKISKYNNIYMFRCSDATCYLVCVKYFPHFEGKLQSYSDVP